MDNTLSKLYRNWSPLNRSGTLSRKVLRLANFATISGEICGQESLLYVVFIVLVCFPA